MKVVALAAVVALGWGSAASAANALWLQHPMNSDIEREYRARPAPSAKPESSS